MAIRNENYSSEELLRDARFHWAALTADPATSGSASTIDEADRRLVAARTATEQAERVRLYCLAVLQRNDFELDDLVRQLELAVEGAVHKDRDSAGYKAVFPNGLDAVTKLRGEAETRECARIRGALGRHFPKLHAAYAAELERLETSTTESERAWKQAEARGTEAFGEEVEERRRLTEAMRKSEGALQMLFAGQKARVRSFFRKTASNVTETPATTPAPTTPSAHA